jgi:hypothetical protein
MRMVRVVALFLEQMLSEMVDLILLRVFMAFGSLRAKPSFGDRTSRCSGRKAGYALTTVKKMPPLILSVRPRTPTSTT